MTKQKKQNLIVKIRGLEWFRGAQSIWNELLEDSTSNQLFLSWSWMINWWTTFSQHNNGSLKIVTVQLETNKIIGIAPLFVQLIRRSGGLKIRRMQFVGTCWRADPVFMTEELGVICRVGWESLLGVKLSEVIDEELEWDEFCIEYAAIEPWLSMVLERFKSNRLAYIRNEKSFPYYFVNTDGCWQEYIGGLSQTVRGKMINRRSRLEAAGFVKLLDQRDVTIPQFFQVLEALHEKRWGECVPEFRRKFCMKIAEESKKRNELAVSILYVNDYPLSAIFNIEIGGVVYNLRSAIDAEFQKNISPGILHFGYALEECFAEKKLRFEFLVGDGKKTDYKKYLADGARTVKSVQIIKRPLLAAAYRIHDYFQ